MIDIARKTERAYRYDSKGSEQTAESDRETWRYFLEKMRSMLFLIVLPCSLLLPQTATERNAELQHQRSCFCKAI